jgi:hypothetical protein
LNKKTRKKKTKKNKDESGIEFPSTTTALEFIRSLSILPLTSPDRDDDQSIDTHQKEYKEEKMNRHQNKKRQAGSCSSSSSSSSSSLERSSRHPSALRHGPRSSRRVAMDGQVLRTHNPNPVTDVDTATAAPTTVTNPIKAGV